VPIACIYDLSTMTAHLLLMYAASFADEQSVLCDCLKGLHGHAACDCCSRQSLHCKPQCAALPGLRHIHG
jgi:hypothetical protein